MVITITIVLLISMLTAIIVLMVATSFIIHSVISLLSLVIIRIDFSAITAVVPMPLLELYRLFYWNNTSRGQQCDGDQRINQHSYGPQLSEPDFSTRVLLEELTSRLSHSSSKARAVQTLQIVFA